MNHSYEIRLEIAGPTAMWTRPDTGDCPVSYPSPTYSAVKGVFESVLWGPAVEIVPFKVEICSPLNFRSYQTNYNGPLRKGGGGTDGNGYQFLATVLTDVCYRLYAHVYPVKKLRPEIELPEKAAAWDKKTTSPGHAYQAIFYRRLKKGRWFSMPFLGWKEFTPSYLGEFRPETRIQSDIGTVVPSMLREVFSSGYKSEVSCTFDQNVRIDHGILVFPQQKELPSA